PPALDLGRDFLAKGIITVEPPRILGHYGVLVPKSDADGNDRGTLLPPEVGVPLATYTGWNLRRRAAGAEGALASLLGSYLPFALTDKERKETGDPRRAVRERYKDFAAYRTAYAAYCGKLVKDGYLLKEDADRLVASRAKVRKLFGE